MKPLVLLILLFCAHLFGGNDVRAVTHHTNTSTAANMKIMQPLQTLNDYEDYTITNNTEATEVNTYLITEEDDEYEYTIRKQISLARNLATLSYTFFLTNLYFAVAKHFLICKSSCSTSFCKYIVQRVLRI